MLQLIVRHAVENDPNVCSVVSCQVPSILSRYIFGSRSGASLLQCSLAQHYFIGGVRTTW